MIGNLIVNYIVWFVVCEKIVVGNQVIEIILYGNWMVLLNFIVCVFVLEFEGFVFVNGIDIQMGFDFVIVYYQMLDKEDCFDKLKSIVVFVQEIIVGEEESVEEYIVLIFFDMENVDFKVYFNFVENGQLIYWNVGDVQIIIVYFVDGRKIVEWDNLDDVWQFCMDYFVGMYVVMFM